MNIIRSIKKLIKKIDKKLFKSALYEYFMTLKWARFLPKLYGIQLDVSGHCNLDCRFCSLKEWNNNPGFMKLETLENLKPILTHLTSLNLSCNCEPLLHPQLFEIIQTIKKINPELEVIFSTNGMLLDSKMITLILESGLDKIYISIDGAKRETYEKIRRGGDFNIVINNLKKIIQQRNSTKNNLKEIGVITVSSKENINELIDILNLVHNIGADTYIVNGLEPYSEYYANQILYDKQPKLEHLEIFKEIKQLIKKYKMNSRIATLKFRPVKKCYLAWITIDWQGNLYPCPFLSYKRDFFFFQKKNPHPQILLGNINNQSIIDILKTQNYINLKYQLATGNLPEFCKHCLKNII